MRISTSGIVFWHLGRSWGLVLWTFFPSVFESSDNLYFNCKTCLLSKHHHSNHPHTSNSIFTIVYLMFGILHSMHLLVIIILSHLLMMHLEWHEFIYLEAKIRCSLLLIFFFEWVKTQFKFTYCVMIMVEYLSKDFLPYLQRDDTESQTYPCTSD